MKKIIIGLVVLVLPLTVSASAMVPGSHPTYSDGSHCTPWKPGQPTAMDPGGLLPGTCRSSEEEQTERIYELEMAVAELQNENAQLRAQTVAPVVSGVQQSGPLEMRVSTLEKSMNVLTAQIMQALTAMIGMIQKLAR